MRLLTLLIPAALVCAGCTSDNPENAAVVPHPIAGKVMYDGKPAAGVVVTLIPSDAPMVPRIPRNPHGVTGSDGRFSITTFTDGDGAAEGGYQVVLTWPGETDENAEGEAKQDVDRLKGWYDGTHSTLSVRVKAGPNELPTYNLPKVVGPPPVSQGVPGRN
jgi:hypothetical protein